MGKKVHKNCAIYFSPISDELVKSLQNCSMSLTKDFLRNRHL